MKKIPAFVFLLSVVMFSCGPGSSDHDLTFILTIPGTPVNTMIPFKPGDYTMKLDRVSVMSGSNSGVEFRWTKNESDNKKLEFVLFLPSSDKFKVWNASAEKVEYTVPDLPFSLTEKDFDNIYSARVHQKVKASMSLNRQTQTISDESSADYLAFSSFTIKVQKFSFDKNYFTMECEFEGSLSAEYKKIIGSDYSVSGKFSIDDVKVGIMNVDD